MSEKQNIYYDNTIEEMGKCFQRIMPKKLTSEEIDEIIEEEDELDYGKEE